MKKAKILFNSFTVLAISAFISSSVLAAQVNINLANATEIADALKGIGQKKAEAIVEYRNENGEFESADELAQVKGIGVKIISKLRKDILLQNP